MLAANTTATSSRNTTPSASSSQAERERPRCARRSRAETTSAPSTQAVTGATSEPWSDQIESGA